MPRHYPVLTIGDVFDFGSLSGASDVAIYTVVTARDPLRIHTTPGSSTPAIGLVAKGSSVEASGRIQSAEGRDYAEVKHPTIGAFGWADLRYLAPAMDAAAIAEKLAVNSAAQAVLDQSAPSGPSPSPSPTPSPSPAPSGGLTRTQFQVSGSLGGWTIVGLAAVVAAIWYVSRDKKR